MLIAVEDIVMIVVADLVNVMIREVMVPHDCEVKGEVIIYIYMIS